VGNRKQLPRLHTYHLPGGPAPPPPAPPLDLGDEAPALSLPDAVALALGDPGACEPLALVFLVLPDFGDPGGLPGPAPASPASAEPVAFFEDFGLGLGEGAPAVGVAAEAVPTPNASPDTVAREPAFAAAEEAAGDGDFLDAGVPFAPAGPAFDDDLPLPVALLAAAVCVCVCLLGGASYTGQAKAFVGQSSAAVSNQQSAVSSQHSAISRRNNPKKKN